MIQMPGATGSAGRTRSAFRREAEMTGNLKRAAPCSLPEDLVPGPCTAGRAVLAARRAVQQVGGGPLAAAVMMMAAYGLWQVFQWGGREDQALIGDLAFLPVSGAAAVLAWRASRRPGLEPGAARAWRLLAVALLLYLLGNLLQLAGEVMLRWRHCPARADVAYLSFYLVAFWGLISFRSRSQPGPRRLRLLLDAAMVLAGGAMLTWYAALSPAIAAGGRGFGLLNVAASAYPVGDLLLLSGTLALLRGAPRSSAPALRVLAAGVLAYIAGDVIYAHLAAHSSYAGGDPVDTLWMAALALAFLAAACQLRAKTSGNLALAPEPAPRHPSALPYLAIAGSYLLFAVAGLRSVRLGSPAGCLLAAAVALAFLASARQHVAVRDYGRLAVRYQELASVDGTTGACSRRHFTEAAEVAVARARRPGQPLVALMIDVDDFKQVNDTHGHAAGDQVLAEMARACQEQVRPGDIVGRYGGDEFIIIAGITGTRATQIAERLARPASHVPGRDGEPLTYSASIGIAECQPDCDLPTLLTHADQAMYEAKRTGGGRWRVFTDTMAAKRNAATPTPQAGVPRHGHSRPPGGPGKGRRAHD